MLNLASQAEKELINQESYKEFSLFSEKIDKNENPNMPLHSIGEDRFIIDEENNLLKNKRKREPEKKAIKTHSKYSYDNLKRKCKHLIIENVMKFVNKKIYEEYNGNLNKGIFKKELVKLNQSQKKNSSAEFNKLFLNKTIKEILSQKITKKIKFLSEDHNKNMINKILEEKKDKFESLFKLTFIECLDHFIGNKQIEELKGLTLFSELKEQIIKKYEKDGELYYNNLEIFFKQFEKRINNAKPRKKSKSNNSNNKI